MSIYRGAGGAGDAVADSSSEALLIRELVAEAQVDADAASASASSAAASASSASTSATNAAASAASINPTLFVQKANNLSDLTSVSIARTNLGVAIGTNVQAWDADLDTWATKTAPSGTVVGTSDTQTLTNKTLTSPVVTGGSINNTPIGATTANTGAFTTLGATGVATFSAGTVSAPAITTTGDTNTGIFFSAVDTIDFTEGGVAVGQFDSSANFKFNSGYGSVVTAYGCRAWVNFNGTGTVAIRGSGNVSSITDNGTGAYTINFTTAMPDANYSTVSIGADITTSTLGSIGLRSASAATTTTVGVGSSAGDGSAFDQAYMNFAIFR